MCVIQFINIPIQPLPSFLLSVVLLSMYPNQLIDHPLTTVSPDVFVILRV